MLKQINLNEVLNNQLNYYKTRMVSIKAKLNKSNIIIEMLRLYQLFRSARRTDGRIYEHFDLHCSFATKINYIKLG